MIPEDKILNFHNVEMEIWKDIKGYEGCYCISNYGRVISLKRKSSIKIKILKENNNGVGYSQVHLCINHIRKAFCIHHLVWDTFGDKQRNGFILTVDHIDNNKRNNKFNNLQLLTNRENCTKGAIMRNKKSSKYTGVSWDKKKNKWRSSIKINYKTINLGTYKSEYEASEVYQKALKEL